jgi:PAS domain S-box-containing protein
MRQTALAGRQAIEATSHPVSANLGNPYSSYRWVFLGCLAIAISYLTARLGGALILRPQMVSPLWLGNVSLVSVLVLSPRRFWPLLFLCGLAGFFLYDLQQGLPIQPILWLILSNSVEILVAAFCLHYCFHGAPQLNSVKTLAVYVFYAVFLAPFIGAFLGALSTRNHYWTSWKVAFFSEALGFLTLLPAILGWAEEISSWTRKPRAFYLEALGLFVALIVLGNLSLSASGKANLPALLYSLVPLLLWSSLRFGLTGVSTSMIAVAFVTIWGAVHGQGPFTESGQSTNVLSLQLFLVFAATPFMFLAVLVEERQSTERELRESEERFRLAAQAGKMFAYEWDAKTDRLVRSEESAQILGIDASTSITGQQILARVHPDDRQILASAIARLSPEKPTLEIRYRMVRPDGTVVWVGRSSRAHFDEQGRITRVVGMVSDITERKVVEDALSRLSRRLIEAQEQDRTRIARELHDDLGQRMALLQIGVEQIEHETAGLSSYARDRLQNVVDIASELSSDLHNLSHQLHPVRLDLQGLVAAMGSLCGEVSKQHSMEINFVHHDVPDAIPEDVALCLFRVAQEALRNVVKHSSAIDATVELAGKGDEINLCISDCGAGFSAESVRSKAGLGLISMEERLRLVSGIFSIESDASHGTRIRARVPITPTATELIQTTSKLDQD